MTETTGGRPLTRPEMAARLVEDIPDGWFVNLGIGIPTLIADCLPPDRDIILHTENGLLGMGPTPPDGDENPWLINAGKKFVTRLPGASYFDHVESFVMVRGGHLDLCVLGAYEVAENGDIANWSTSVEDTAPAVGGAMDLAVGAKRAWVLMEHTTKDGTPKLVENCSYPLTASAAVSRIYTNLAVIDVQPEGFVVREIFGGLSQEALQAQTAAKLHFRLAKAA